MSDAPASWNCALELRPDRTVAAGSFDGLCASIGRGADLRIYTEFLFEEHIVAGGDGDPRHNGLMREVIDFRQAYLLDGRHAAGVTTLRQPLHPPFGFNGRQPKMSFFLYNMDGRQACANLLLDEAAALPPGARSTVPCPADMPKMSAQDVFDEGSSGPSRNFIYDMDVYRFFVRDEWQEVLSHDADGVVTGGSFDALEAAQVAAKEIKVGIRGLCADLGGGPEHEVFSLVGSGFLHTGMRVYDTLTHPLVRVRPAIPLQYGSSNWDVAWVYLRTDGQACLRVLDSHTRRFADREARYACRWFAR